MFLAGFIMRIFSYLFHLVLALFLLGISSLAWASGLHNLKIGILPWQEAALTYTLFGLGLAAILIIVLSLKGILKVLFPLWSFVVLAMLIRGYVLSPFSFASRTELWTAVILTLAALVATLGAWLAYRARPARG